jgi:hypothetical protein
MIPPEPQLPMIGSQNYDDNLNWKLTQLLREIITAINRMSGSTWDGFHPILGGHHLWVDATGDLRIKSGAPASDTDGVVVGTQT